MKKRRRHKASGGKNETAIKRRKEGEGDKEGGWVENKGRNRDRKKQKKRTGSDGRS